MSQEHFVTVLHFLDTFVSVTIGSTVTTRNIYFIGESKNKLHVLVLEHIFYWRKQKQVTSYLYRSIYFIGESKNKLHVLVSEHIFYWRKQKQVTLYLYHMKFLYLSYRRAAKAQTSLRIRAVSPESSRLTYTT